MELLIHLLFLLYHLFLRLIAWRPPKPYVFTCPTCNEIRMSKFREHIRYDHKMRPVAGQRTFTCDTCKSTFDADRFHADPHGIYQPNTWDCPHCTHLNPATTFRCQECGFKLA